MTVLEAIGQAYQNGYAAGYADGKRDAVKHGRWIEKHNYFLGCYESTDYKCSVCGLERDYLGGANYCPNCGADMRGEKK